MRVQLCIVELRGMLTIQLYYGKHVRYLKVYFVEITPLLLILLFL